MDHRHSLGHSGGTLHFRGRRLAWLNGAQRRLVAFDALALLEGLALFALNNRFLKPLGLPGPWGVFFSNYCNDLLCGFAFMGYANLLFDFVRPQWRMRSWTTTLIFMLCCGLFWELVAPLFIKPNVADPWDIVVYLLGATLYHLKDMFRGSICVPYNPCIREKAPLQGESGDEEDPMSIYEKLDGKRIDVNYETGYHFVIQFLSENELEWHALVKTAEGAPAVEREPYSSLEMAPGVYMINWIEESGLVVSQIDDFNQGKVFAFMTWPDSDARGSRAELLHKGTLTVLE